MKKKKLFKNRLQMIIYIIIFIICILLFIVIGKSDYSKKDVHFSKKISEQFNHVSEDNVFISCNASEVLSILKGKSSVILMGFTANKFTNDYAGILNDVAKEIGIDEICYYDFLKDRDESNGTYEMIVKKLDVYAPLDDEGNQNIYAPTIIIIKNGDVMGYFNHAYGLNGNVDANDFYSADQKTLIAEQLRKALTDYLN